MEVKNKRWDAGVDFDVGWKELPFEKTLNACVISKDFQPLVPLSVGKCLFSGPSCWCPKQGILYMIYYLQYS